MTPSDLCTACGVCCDGTLFQEVRLQPEDDPAAVEALGILVRAGEVPTFALRCAALKGSCCSVYAARPSICRSYRCRLLNRLGAGEIAGTEALAIVARTQRARDRVRAAFASVAPDAAVRSIPELQRLCPSPEALGADRALAVRWTPCMTALAWLLELVETEFRTKSEKAARERL